MNFEKYITSMRLQQQLVEGKEMIERNSVRNQMLFDKKPAMLSPANTVPLKIPKKKKHKQTIKVQQTQKEEKQLPQMPQQDGVALKQDVIEVREVSNGVQGATIDDQPTQDSILDAKTNKNNARIAGLAQLSLLQPPETTSPMMNSTVKGSKIGDTTTKNLMNMPQDEVVFQHEESSMYLKQNMKNMHQNSIGIQAIDGLQDAATNLINQQNQTSRRSDPLFYESNKDLENVIQVDDSMRKSVGEDSADSPSRQVSQKLDYMTLLSRDAMDDKQKKEKKKKSKKSGSSKKHQQLTPQTSIKLDETGNDEVENLLGIDTKLAQKQHLMTNDQQRIRTADNFSKSVLNSKKKQNVKDSQEIRPSVQQNLIEIKLLERLSNSTEKYNKIGEKNTPSQFEKQNRLPDQLKSPHNITITSFQHEVSPLKSKLSKTGSNSNIFQNIVNNEESLLIVGLEKQETQKSPINTAVVLPRPSNEQSQPINIHKVNPDSQRSHQQFQTVFSANASGGHHVTTGNNNNSTVIFDVPQIQETSQEDVMKQTLKPIETMLLAGEDQSQLSVMEQTVFSLKTQTTSQQQQQPKLQPSTDYATTTKATNAGTIHAIRINSRQMQKRFDAKQGQQKTPKKHATGLNRDLKNESVLTSRQKSASTVVDTNYFQDFKRSSLDTATEALMKGTLSQTSY